METCNLCGWKTNNMERHIRYSKLFGGKCTRNETLEDRLTNREINWFFYIFEKIKQGKMPFMFFLLLLSVCFSQNYTALSFNGTSFCDNFGDGGTCDHGTNANWVQIATMEPSEGWSGTADTTNYKEGTQGIKEVGGSEIKYTMPTRAILSTDNITFWAYCNTTSASGLRIGLGSPELNIYYTNWQAITTGWNYYNLPRSAFSNVAGSPDWNSINATYLEANGATITCTFDDLRAVGSNGQFYDSMNNRTLWTQTSGNWEIQNVSGKNVLKDTNSVGQTNILMVNTSTTFTNFTMYYTNLDTVGNSWRTGIIYGTNTFYQGLFGTANATYNGNSLGISRCVLNSECKIKLVKQYQTVTLHMMNSSDANYVLVGSYSGTDVLSSGYIQLLFFDFGGSRQYFSDILIQSHIPPAINTTDNSGTFTSSQALEVLAITNSSDGEIVADWYKNGVLNQTAKRMVAYYPFDVSTQTTLSMKSIRTMETTETWTLHQGAGTGFQGSNVKEGVTAVWVLGNASVYGVSKSNFTAINLTPYTNITIWIYSPNWSAVETAQPILYISNDGSMTNRFQIAAGTAGCPTSGASWYQMNIAKTSFGTIGSPSWSAITNVWLYVSPSTTANLNMSFDALNGTSLTSDYTPDMAITPTANGTVSGATWTPNGKIGGAYSFDGINDVITGSNTTKYITANKSFCAMFWFYQNSTTTSQGLMGGSTANQPFTFDTQSTPRIRFYVFDSPGGTIATANYNFNYYNTWTHVAGCYDETSKYIFLYINGAFATNVSAATGFITGASDSLVEGYSYGDNYFNGSIDEVRIYNQSLSADEIGQIYRDGMLGKTLPNQPNITNASVWYVNMIATSGALVSENVTYRNTNVVINSVSISPSPTANTSSTLLGYCNATSGDGSSIDYNYTWYRNWVLNKTGTVYGFISGSNVNVNNITSTLAYGENWTLQCTGILSSDSSMFSSALNSSQTYINYTQYISNQTYDLTAFETTVHYFSITIGKDSSITAAGANITYNGTVYPASLISQNSTQFTYGVNVTVPLVATNNTAETYNWTYLYNVSGTIYSANSSSNTQAVYWAYYPISASATPTIVMEGQIYLISTDIINLSAATIVPKVNINNTLYDVNYVSGTTWNSYEIAPSFFGSAPNITNSITSVLNVTFGADSYLRNYTGATNFTVMRLVLSTNCSSGTPLVNYTFYDQNNLSLGVITDVSGAFTIVPVGSNVTFNGTFNATGNNATLCISGTITNGTYYLSSVMTYTGQGGYRTLYHYLLNEQITVPNILNVSLYDLNTTGSTATKFTVYKTGNQVVSGAYLKIMRYYPYLNQYLLAGMGKTDSNGDANSYLIPLTIQYRYDVYDSTGVLLFSSEDATFACDPSATLCEKTLNIGSVFDDHLYTFYTQYVNDTGCVYDNNTYTINCFANNPTGTWSNLHLQVWQFNGTMMYLVCDNSTIVLPGTTSCVLTDHYGSYYYTAKITTGSPEGMFISALVNLIPVKARFSNGMLGALALTIIGAGIGVMFGFAPCIIFASVGFLLSILLGFVYVEWWVIGGIISMAVLAAAIMKK